MHTIKAEPGCHFNDIVVSPSDIDTFALASEDGSVTVRELLVSQSGSSFVFDDASNQTITSETRHFVQHSSKGIDHLVFFASRYTSYCAASGSTVYSGNSDAQINLKSSITQLKTFKSSSGTPVIAAGLGRVGEIHLLETDYLTRI